MRHIWRMFLSELGKTIRERRERHGLSQAAFAQTTGIPRRTLTRLEHGDPAVRIGTFEKAARALGLGLVLSDLKHRRPTLEELESLYGEDRSDGDGTTTRLAPSA